MQIVFDKFAVLQKPFTNVNNYSSLKYMNYTKQVTAYSPLYPAKTSLKVKKNMCRQFQDVSDDRGGAG